MNVRRSHARAAVLGGAGLRIALGAVLVYASLLKLDAPFQFAVTVYDYRIVSGPSALAVAAVVPTIELVIGLSLIAGILERAALMLSALLLAVFTVVQGSALTRGLEIGCGCFNPDADGLVTLTTFARTLLLCAVAVGLLWLRHTTRGVPSCTRC